MPKLLAIARAEIGYHASHWSFYLTTLGIPLIFAALGALPRLYAVADATQITEVETVFTQDEVLTAPTGYIDQVGLILDIPAAQADLLRPFADEATARIALNQGDIDSYYIIPNDYLTRGTINQYSTDPQLLSASDGPMRDVVRANLNRQIADRLVAGRVEDPINIIPDGPPIPPISFIPPDLDLQRLASAALVVGLFTYMINIGGSLLVRSLQREVKEHVLEIIIASTTPTQFVGGKIVGTCAIALLQAGLAIMAALWVYGNNPDGTGPASLSLTSLALSLPYLLLGFAAYAGAMMSIVVLWPNPRESGFLTTISFFVVMFPLLGVLFIIPDLDSTLTVFLTTFPLTAFLLMPFRLLLTPVPWWQWLIGLLMIFVWATALFTLSVRLFRMRSLLTGSGIWGLMKIRRGNSTATGLGTGRPD